MEEKRAVLLGKDAGGKEIVIAEAEGEDAERLIEEAEKAGTEVRRDPEALAGIEGDKPGGSGGGEPEVGEPEVAASPDADRLASLAFELYSFVEELDALWMSENADRFEG